MQIAVRLPLSVVKSLDDFAKEKSEATPGLRFTRADSVRTLVMLGLLMKIQVGSEKE